MIAGDKGKVLYTSDRGSTWSTISLATTHSLNGISLVRVLDNEEYIGYIVGDAGKIYKHNIKRWADISVNSDFDLKSVAFRNSVNGIAVGQKNSSLGDTYANSALDGARASIITTLDGGKTWLENTFMVKGKFNSVVFVNKYRAIAVGDNGLMAISDNGGITWRLTDKNYSVNFNKIEFCPLTIGAVVGDNMGTVLISTDDGDVWTKVTSDCNFCVRSICSKDSKTFTAVGEAPSRSFDKDTEGVIMESKDNGKSWTQIFSNQKGTYNYIEFCNKSFGIAVGNGGAITVYQYNRHDDPPSLHAQLNLNYPNPFNPSTKISYIISNTENVRISILNVLGEEISVLVNEEKDAGNYEVVFTADNLPSGVYF